MTVEGPYPPEEIIEASPPYAAVISQLHQACFPAGWSTDSLADMLGKPGVIALIAASTGEPTPYGFIVCRHAVEEGEVITLGVLPDHRRRGLGKLLLGGAISRLTGLGVETLFLEVEAGNSAAIGLYESFGFVTTAIREGYYKPSDGRRDAAVMRLDLLGDPTKTGDP